MARYRWSDDELEHVVEITTGLIGNLSYHLQRAHGLVYRLQEAVRHDCKLAVDSLAARKLRRDAAALRTLARQIDSARAKLTVQS